MKKTISILLAVLMLVGCMSIGFSASAVTTLTVCGFYVSEDNSGGVCVYLDDIEFAVLSNGSPLNADNFKDSIYVKTGGNTYYYSENESLFTWDGFTSTESITIGFVNLLANSIVQFKLGCEKGEVSVLAAKNGTRNYECTLTPADVTVPITRLDVTFSADPAVGAVIGTDFSIDLTATAESTNKFYDLELRKGNGGIIPSTIGEYKGLSWPNPKSSYVAIVDDSGEIVYPKAVEMNYAPATATDSESDPNGTVSYSNRTYEAGRNYYFYANIGLGYGYKFTEDTEIYLNGTNIGTASDWTELNSINRSILFWLDERTVTEKLSAVNIDFSADPKEGTPVGSDYSIKITPSPDMTFVTGKPMVNEPAPPAGFFGKTEYKPSYVAIYESNNLLYPGYSFIKYNFAPVQSSDPTGANGNPPAQDNGNTVLSSTPSNYALGKTYKYYAIFKIDDVKYLFDANTAFNVNGVKATDVTLSSDGKAVQVYLGEKTPGHVHNMTYHGAVAATTEAGGNVAYYHCEGCGLNFADEAGTQQLSTVTTDKLPTQTEPTTKPNQGNNDQGSTKSGSCKYCGQDHTGFAGFFTRIFHSILALFGLRKK